jgi:hypothetical protein
MMGSVCTQQEKLKEKMISNEQRAYHHCIIGTETATIVQSPLARVGLHLEHSQVSSDYFFVTASDPFMLLTLVLHIYNTE